MSILPWLIMHNSMRASRALLKDVDGSFRPSKGMIAGGAIAISGVLVFAGGLMANRILSSKEYSLERNALAEKTEIAYQMKDAELKDLAEGYENGEYTFGEFTVKMGEIQSEKYIQDKAQTLLDADEEFKTEQSELEKGEKIGLGVALGGAAAAIGIPLVGVGVYAVQCKMASKDDENENE